MTIPTSSALPFSLHPGSVVKAVSQGQQDLTGAFKVPGEAQQKLDEVAAPFLEPYGDTLTQLSGKSPREAKVELLHDQPSLPWIEQFRQQLPIAAQPTLDALRQEGIRVKGLWDSTYDSMRSGAHALSAWLIPRLAQYKADLFTYRLDPDHAEIALKHPRPVRVVSSITQNGGSRTIQPGETASLGVQTFINHIQTAPSLNDAIDGYEQTLNFIPSDMAPVNPETPNYPPIPHLEKAIATPYTPLRPKTATWQKSDNANPYVRRILIQIYTDDGSTEARQNAQAMRQQFVQQPVHQPHQAIRPDQYRVDEIIQVPPITPQERQRGITQADKIRQAYKALDGFVTQQRTLAHQQGLDPNRLQFEGFCSWIGHGMTMPNQGPGDQDDRRFLEGSKEFYFITRHRPGAGLPEGLSETEIKQLEAQHVQPFASFIQHVQACSAGAFIA